MQITTHEKTAKVLLIKLNVRTNEFKKRQNFKSTFNQYTKVTLWRRKRKGENRK